MATKPDPLSVHCPICAAAPGKPCVSVGELQPEQAHFIRVKYARRTMEHAVENHWSAKMVREHFRRERMN